MWLPDSFYELLPYIYAIAGFSIPYHFGTPNGYSVGVTYLLIAGLAWIMRRDYREEKEKMQDLSQ
jgi:hypothetical protein